VVEFLEHAVCGDSDLNAVVANAELLGGDFERSVLMFL